MKRFAKNRASNNRKVSDLRNIVVVVRHPMEAVKALVE